MVVWIPLDGEVGETPGAALMKSNMLARRVGIPSMSSEPKRVPNPGFRASMREPVPSTTTDSSTPASFSVAVLSIVEPAAIKMSCRARSQTPASRSRVRTVREGGPGTAAAPLICHLYRRAAYQRRRTDADARTREDEALFVLDRAYESPRQPLRGTDSWQQDTDSDQRATVSAGLAWRMAVVFESSCNTT